MKSNNYLTIVIMAGLTLSMNLLQEIAANQLPPWILNYTYLTWPILGASAIMYITLVIYNTRTDKLKGEVQQQQINASIPRKIDVQANRRKLSLKKRKRIKIDWGDYHRLVDSSNFYNRLEELSTLEEWILNKGCVLVTIVGIGGQGKSTLCGRLVLRLQCDFDYIIWRSLNNERRLDKILDDFIYFIAKSKPSKSMLSIDDKLQKLKELLTQNKVLLILDNVESVLTGKGEHIEYLSEYKDFGKLFATLGTIKHGSCMLVTTRRAPPEIQELEKKVRFIKTYPLRGLKFDDAKLIMHEYKLSGRMQDFLDLNKRYGGNPQMIHMASAYVSEENSDLTDFLSKTITIDTIYELLDDHFNSLSPEEKDIIFTIAIAREPMDRKEIYENLGIFYNNETLNKVLHRLIKLKRIELYSDDTFSLHPMLMEYFTSKLHENLATEIGKEDFEFLNKFALVKATAKDFIREIQKIYLIDPLIRKMIYKPNELAEKLYLILENLKSSHKYIPGYAAGNIVTILKASGFEIKGKDFSKLSLRQASFDGMKLHHVNFAGSDLAHARFSEAFGPVMTCDVSCQCNILEGDVLAIGGTFGEISILELNTGKKINTFRDRHEDWIRSLAFSPCGKFLISGAEDKKVRVWDAKTGKCLNCIDKHESWVNDVVCTDEFIFSGCEDGKIKIWNFINGELLETLAEHNGRINDLAISQHEKILVSCGDDGLILFYSLNDFSIKKKLDIKKLDNTIVTAVVFSSKNRNLYCGCLNSSIIEIDVSLDYRLTRLDSKHAGSIRCIALSSDENILATGSEDTTICLWNIRERSADRILYGHTNWINSLRFGCDSNFLVSSSEDQTVKIWEVSAGNCVRTLFSYSQWIRSLIYIDNDRIAFGCDDGKIRLWNSNDSEVQYRFRGHSNRVRSLIRTKDKACLISCSDDHTIRIWSIVSKTTNDLIGHKKAVRSLSLNFNETVLASGGDDHTIKLWDFVNQTCIHTLHEHSEWIWAVVFHPSKNILASGSDDKLIKLWNIDQNNVKNAYKTLEGHDSGVWALDFNNTGTILASGGEDGILIFWDFSTFKFSKHGEHKRRIRTVQFSPDGKYLATGSEDFTINLWDVKTRKKLYSFEGHQHHVMTVAFSPNSKFIASGSADENVKIWDLDTKKEVLNFSDNRPYEGLNISNVQGINDSQKRILKKLGAIE